MFLKHIFFLIPAHSPSHIFKILHSTIFIVVYVCSANGTCRIPQPIESYRVGWMDGWIINGGEVVNQPLHAGH
jgi:hypothetical protein